MQMSLHKTRIKRGGLNNRSPYLCFSHLISLTDTVTGILTWNAELNLTLWDTTML